MTDRALDRLLEDLRKVPLVDEALVEAYQDGRWLYEPACVRCGAPLDERRPCVACRNRHEKRRQRGGRPAPLIGTSRAGIHRRAA